MSKQFDELAKDLAKGVSRRSAIGRFLAGIGATVGGVLFTRGKARAESHAQYCIDYCKACYEGEEYGQCMAHSVQCSSPHSCAVLQDLYIDGQYNNTNYCPPVNNSYPMNGTKGCGQGTWTCIPMVAGNRNCAFIEHYPG